MRHKNAQVICQGASWIHALFECHGNDLVRKIGDQHAQAVHICTIVELRLLAHLKPLVGRNSRLAATLGVSTAWGREVADWDRCQDDLISSNQELHSVALLLD